MKGRLDERTRTGLMESASAAGEQHGVSSELMACARRCSPAGSIDDH